MKPHYQDIRVLVVDDSRVSRKLLEHTLDLAPYILVFAKDGSDALRLFAERPPDLVVAPSTRPPQKNPRQQTQTGTRRGFRDSQEASNSCRSDLASN